MLWAVLLGYFIFGELPAAQVWIGAVIVIAAGLVILWREHKLGRQRVVSRQRALSSTTL
jgi:drug/metabolite transporter (DMT)-like permease